MKTAKMSQKKKMGGRLDTPSGKTKVINEKARKDQSTGVGRDVKWKRGGGGGGQARQGRGGGAVREPTKQEGGRLTKKIKKNTPKTRTPQKTVEKRPTGLYTKVMRGNSGDKTAGGGAPIGAGWEERKGAHGHCRGNVPKNSRSLWESLWDTPLQQWKGE